MSQGVETGRLIAVVGASGVGKDSVMQGLAAALPDLSLVTRVITRAPGLGGEDYDAVSPETFEQMRRQDRFCLHWEAHGLQYGIPVAVQSDVAGGEDKLVNLSRQVLVEAMQRFPRLLIINLTAAPETLRARVKGRGREEDADAERRLVREAPKFDPRLNLHSISNDGALEDTIQSAVELVTRDGRMWLDTKEAASSLS